MAIVAKVVRISAQELDQVKQNKNGVVRVPRKCLEEKAKALASRQEVRGEIDLLIQIGPYTYRVTFQVMDINPAYSCLLGQPWIHSVGVIPSTLHQKLKFVVEGHLVIVSGEEDVLVSCSSFKPYVEAMEESSLLCTSFNSA